MIKRLFNYRTKEDNEKVQEFLLANKYDSTFDELWEQSIRKYIYRHTRRLIFTANLLPALKDGARVLEIGAVPYCLSTILMENFSCNITTIDLPPDVFLGESRDIEKGTIKISNSIANKNYIITKCTCNAEKDIYPFENDYFDVIICTEVLEHLLYSPSHLFNESYRVLKKNGRMVISTVNTLYFKRMENIILNKNIDDGYSQAGPYERHNRNYTRKELIDLAESNNFKVRSVVPITLRGEKDSSFSSSASTEKGKKSDKNIFLEKGGKFFKKLLHELIKLLVHLPLPGMKDKRFYHIFLLLEK